MIPKRMWGWGAGIVILGALFVFVYQEFKSSAGENDSFSKQNKQMTVPAAADQKKKLAEPATIDEMSASINAEAMGDLSALDDEADGEISEIEGDSESINNLGTSYDENDL